MKMNRQQRRNVKANAPAIAEEMARLAYDYTPEGELVRVADPVAQAALKRAFLHMLKNGCEPHTTRISDVTAAAFPRAKQPPAGVSTYLAVGLDPDGRGTYSIRSITTPGAPAHIAEVLNREYALRHLQEHTARRGFPIWGE
jgi:hypothetical protein